MIIIRRVNPARPTRDRAVTYVGSPCPRCGGNIRRLSNRTCATCVGRAVVVEHVDSVRQANASRQIAPC